MFPDKDPTISAKDIATLRERIDHLSQNQPYYQNIAILGCGYIGMALASCWDEYGHCVTGTTTRETQLPVLSQLASKAVVLKGDDAEKIESLLEGQDCILISVAPKRNKAHNEEIYEKTYLATAHHLVDALSRAQSVKQVIFLSSCSIYGDRQGEWVDETSPIIPSTRRIEILAEAENKLLGTSNDERNVCILRLGGIYGPGRELVKIYGGLAGKTVPGRGDRIINWVNRDDVIAAIEFARRQHLQGIYNLVDDSQLSVREQLDLICSSHGLPDVNWDPSQENKARVSLRVSNQKLKTAGYELIHSKILP